MTATAEPASNGSDGNGYKIIGTRPICHDGLDKVIGRAQYGADIHLPGMLFGKVLRSPHAHGIGEVPIVPPPAAIANAIGVRQNHLPMNSRAILEALGKA